MSRRLKVSGSIEVIEHDGIVQKSDNKSVTVKISSESACAGCNAERSCAMSGREDKLVDIAGSFNVAPGENVTVIMKKSAGYAAVMIAYVLPLLLVVAFLIILISFSVPEAAAGLGSVGILIPYYLILWLFRNKINNKFTFSIKAS